ncbi:MAG: hypothetical protein NUV52_04300 [Candidatus Roizmanbacteria bacterium]|nr:hypothetical protein [Candidatus Roizmanbacteria bacterium]
MSNIIEGFRAARARIKPEGFAFSAASSYMSPTIMVPLYGALTYAAHEANTVFDTNAFTVGAIAVLGIANAISITAEAKALTKEGYSSSVIANTLQVATGNPLLSSIGGHVSNYAQLFLINPINSAALLSENRELLTESLGATSLTLTAWLTAMNSLVITGKTKEFTDGVTRVRKYIAQKIIPARQK